MDRAGVAEAHFSLGRMDVDVDRLRIDFQEEHDRRMTVEVEGLRRAIRRVRQNAIAHETPIDEEELIAPAAEAKAARHEAGGMRGFVALLISSREAADSSP